MTVLNFRLMSCYGNAQNKNGKHRLDTRYSILDTGYSMLDAGGWQLKG